MACDVCRYLIIYTLHHFNTLITDQGAWETAICIPTETLDYIKSHTNRLKREPQSRSLSRLKERSTSRGACQTNDELGDTQRLLLITGAALMLK